MLKKLKNKEKTVAEKVAETILHPNNSSSESETDSSNDAKAARVVEYDSDEYELPQAGATEIRKRNVKLLSEQNAKYKGKIVSRKEFENDESEDESDYESSVEEALTSFTKALKNNQNKQLTEFTDSDNQASDEVDESDDFEDDQNDDSELDSDDEEEEGESEVISQINHEAEIQKGLCVQNQLRIWERVLDLRINLQKIVTKTNQLPEKQDQIDLKETIEYKNIKETTCKQTGLLLQNLLQLKKHLSSQFSEVDKAMKTSLKRPSPFNDHNSSEPPLKQISRYLEADFEQFRSYRNEVLLKWDDRTRLLQPGAGSKKKAFNEEYDVIKKIDNALTNKSLLIETSQLKNAALNDSTEKSIRNPNIYDDTDFYHQQLRELIEFKASTTNSMSEVTKQFVELQKLRQKMKKKVDTRASKGRKIRYIVHNKLLNFMAPIDNSTWTMESIDELSKSLFV